MHPLLTQEGVVGVIPLLERVGALHPTAASASVAQSERGPAVTDAERLNELEIRLTHQSLQLEELSSELLGCYRRIEALEREARRMRDMLGTFAPDLIESPDE